MESEDGDSRYKELLASVPSPYGDENLETLLDCLNSYHYCLVDSESAYDNLKESYQKADNNIDKVIAKLKTYADGTTFIPKSDLPFVAPYTYVNGIKEVMRANTQSDSSTLHNVFLSRVPRQYMERLTKQMMDLNHMLDFTELTRGLNNIVDDSGRAAVLPLEVLWWLHHSELFLLTTYIYDNLGDADKLAELKNQLFSLICSFESVSSQHHTLVLSGGATTTDCVEQRMVRDLLGCLLSSSQRTHLKCSKACSVLLDSIVKKMISRLVQGEEDPPGNFLKILRKDALLSADDVRGFASETLHRFLTLCPNISLRSAISKQTDWLYDKTSPHITSFLRDVLESSEINQVLKILQEDLKQAEVNWKHLLITVSTLVVCIQDANKRVKTLISSMVEEALTSKNREMLTSVFLIARQCCSEVGSSFPSYSAWFSVTFSSDITSLAFKFLMEFLQDLIPMEPPPCLRAHINKPPTAPSGLNYLVAEYTTIARTRLQDLNEDTAPSMLGNDSLDEDVARIVRHYEKTGNVYPPLINAVQLLRQQFEKELLPKLIAGGHRDIVNKLVKMGRISEHSVNKLSRGDQAAITSKWNDVGPEELRRLLTRTAEELGVSWNVEAPVQSAVTTLTELLPLRDKTAMEFTKQFSLNVMSMAKRQSDLALPQSLVKKMAFVCERLQCLNVSTITDHSDELSLTEWLNYEACLLVEFLSAPLLRLYLRRAATCFLRSHTNFREVFSKIVNKLLEVDNAECFNAVAVGLAIQALPTDNSEKLPVLLDLWSSLDFHHTHANFFRGSAFFIKLGTSSADALMGCIRSAFFSWVVQLFPEWFLWTNSLACEPSQETVRTIAGLINVDLLDVLCVDSLLMPEFLSHLMVGLNHVSTSCGSDVAASSLAALLHLSTAVHLAVLVYYRGIRCFIDPLLAANVASLNKLKGVLQTVYTTTTDGQLNFHMEDHLSCADDWGVAAIFWFHCLRNEGDRAWVKRVEKTLTRRSGMCRWLFLFRVLEVARSLDRHTASFSVVDDRMWFVCDDVEHESPLQVLESYVVRDPGVVRVLQADATETPFNMFSEKTLGLVSMVGLLFLIERRLSKVTTTTDVQAVLPALGKTLFAALGRGLGPEFLVTKDPNNIRQLRERREFLDYVKKACHEMTATAHAPAQMAPVETRKDEDFIIMDDDYLEIPDDLP